MKTMTFKFSVLALVASAGLVGFADTMDRPSGIKIGQRMTLKPYVSTSVAYDSNAQGSKKGKSDVLWIVNPGFGLEYKSEQWAANLNAYYQFQAHSRNTSSTRDTHSYGEELSIRWTDSLPNEKGWSLVLSESFRMMNEVDDIKDPNGNQFNQDRQEFTLSGAIERRITDRFHANVNGGYYWLDYLNNDHNRRAYQSLYGWQRWTAGAVAGYALSPWTDLLLSFGWQRYHQDNTKNAEYIDSKDYRRGGLDSTGYSIQTGFGTYATERIQYRVLGGWMNYSYDHGGKDLNGFSYSVSGAWTLSNSWKTMLLAQSSYQPTEREFGSSQRVDMISWGLAHAMVRGKLNATFDASYRRETKEYSADKSGYDYDLDYMTFRFGLNYTLNRYLGFFGNVEYRNSISSKSTGRGAQYDYDRFRGTLGMRFTY